MFRLLLVPALALGLSALPAAGADFTRTASYVVNVGGINVANADVTLGETSGAYSLVLKADVSGLGQLVANGKASASTRGTLSGATLSPGDFSMTTRTGEGTFEVDVGFAKGDVTRFTVSPPIVNELDRVPIERSHLAKVTDMMTAFVVKGGALDQSLCNRQLRIFTGLERFDLAMRFAKADTATSARTGYQGPVVLCNARYTPVSGHYTTSGMTEYLAGLDRILLWYAPLGDTGYFIPYRALLATGAGDLSIVLTALR